MKTTSIATFLALLFYLSPLTTWAQGEDNSAASSKQKKFSFQLGIGYFRPILSDDGVAYPNGTYDPNIGLGFSYFGGFNYAFLPDFTVGVAYDGNYASAEFIEGANIDGQTVDGYLEAGAVTNSMILVNASYVPQGDGIKPYARLGMGYINQQVELGDVPLELTNDVETEIFPDYKSSGFVFMPEVGARYGKFFLSAAYSIPIDDLTGEIVDTGFTSSGTVTSQGLQIKFTYNLFQF
ncbi:MAG: hypothetical protein AAGB22_00895 [Bacteroidota bacterium]